VVVSVGGDGMLSSLAGLVAERGGTLAVVPAGRGNDFARMLGLPQDPTALAQVLLDAEPRAVDLVAATFPDQPRRVVAGSVYCGVDARAGEIVDKAHWLPSAIQYPYAALRALATYQPARYLVDIDGTEHTFEASNVVVANSGYYGKGMRIAPAAVVDDGLLDIVVIEAASKLALMRSLPKVYDGKHVDLPQVTCLTGRRFEVRADAARPVAVGGDGEPLGSLPPRSGAPLTVEVLPGALSVLAR
jgi:diacylglycerol kinase (ATP)